MQNSLILSPIPPAPVPTTAMRTLLNAKGKQPFRLCLIELGLHFVKYKLEYWRVISIMFSEETNILLDV